MSEIKVNKISPRAACGTVQLGDSGDTFTIPAGATINNQGTATNFGATGSASWVTTVKTSGFTAVAGEGYFVNTTSGPISVNLPAGTAGAVVAIKDYAGTFDTNALTLVQNGSDKIGGSAVNATLATEGIAVTLVFVDSTQGWLVTDSGLQSEAPGPAFITATGGTITTVCTNFKVHTFTGPGTFTVCSVGNAAGSNTVDYLVVGGAGGGGGNNPSAYADGSGGGGAGGARMSSGAASGCYAASPLGACVSALPVSATSFPITVGGGGASTPGPGTARGCNGVNSVFSSITSAGGGGGGTHSYTTPLIPNRKGNDGGSGGGPGGGFTCGGNFGEGNTPPTNPAQGQNSGAADSAPDNTGAGGGGAGGIGTNGAPGPGRSGDGGIGITNAITGSNVVYAGGGGGSARPPIGKAGGFGGINPGGSGPAPQTDRGGAGNGVPPGCGTAGSANTGGGGGAGAKGNTGSSIGGTGGSGIVVIRYKFQ